MLIIFFNVVISSDNRTFWRPTLVVLVLGLHFNSLLIHHVQCISNRILEHENNILEQYPSGGTCTKHIVVLFGKRQKTLSFEAFAVYSLKPKRKLYSLRSSIILSPKLIYFFSQKNNAFQPCDVHCWIKSCPKNRRNDYESAGCEHRKTGRCDIFFIC